MRVVDGSPDIETSNPTLPPTAPKCNFGTTVAGFGTLVSASIGGTMAAASFPYKAVSPYVAVAPGSANVAINPPGGTVTGCPPYSFSVPGLKANSYQTIVIAGAYQSGTLQFVLFDDAAPGSAASVRFYNASPLAGTIGAGSFVTGTTNYQSAGTAALGATVTLPAATSAPGLTYFIGSAATPSAVLAPSQVYSLDTNDVVPFGNLSQLALYAIDPPLGGISPVLIGEMH